MGGWKTEILRSLLWLFVAAIVGGSTGLFLLLTLFAVLGLLVYQLFQIKRFERWLSAGAKGEYPATKGVWEDIYYHLYRVKKDDRKRKKKLGKMIDAFRKSTEALPDAAVVLGKYDEIEWANKKAMEVLGLKQSDKGQRIPNLIRFPEFVSYLKSGNFNEPITVPSPIDKRIILTLRVVAYGQGLRLLLAQDVTQLKKMELMRKDFVANVSHELRTPLTVLKGYLETLQDLDEGQSPLLLESLKHMQGQTERMQHLVDNLLLLTRLETQQLKSQCVDIPALLQQICREGDTIAQNNQRIELILETDAYIRGEEQELRSAFTNLVGNALKYSADETKVVVRWYRSSNELILEVQDKGEGIALLEIPRVTERFYRCEVKREHSVKGTGLGLAIVKHVLMRHDAQLKIDSTLGKGSCFRCCFPLKRMCSE